jgi:hypothetical protein
MGDPGAMPASEYPEQSLADLLKPWPPSPSIDFGLYSDDETSESASEYLK